MYKHPIIVIFFVVSAFFFNSKDFLVQDIPPTPLPPLSEQIGFYDPIFAELEADRQNTLGDSTRFEAYSHQYRLLAIWAISPDYPEMVDGGTALLYQMDGNQPQLIWSKDYSGFHGQTPSVDSASPLFHAPSPGDWNNDGKAEFGVYGFFAGTAWYSNMLYVYQLKPDNEVVSIFKGKILPGHIVISAEKLNDGTTILLTLTDVRGEGAMKLSNCCGPLIHRYYEWRERDIVEASAKYLDNYVQPLGNTIYRLTTSNITDPVEYSARLLEVLMIYDALDQREAGWALAQQIVQQAKQTGRLPEGTYVDETFMPAMAQLYESGTLFVAPDKIDHVTDFYAEDS